LAGRAELVGSSVLDRLHPEDVETVRAQASLAMETDQFEGLCPIRSRSYCCGSASLVK
jgi:hypothetical protein